MSAKDTASDAKVKASDIGDITKDKAADAWDTTKDKAHDLKEKADDKADEVKDKGKSLTEKAGDAFSGSYETVKEKASDIADSFKAHSTNSKEDKDKGKSLINGDAEKKAIFEGWLEFVKKNRSVIKEKYHFELSAMKMQALYGDAPSCPVGASDKVQKKHMQWMEHRGQSKVQAMVNYSRYISIIAKSIDTMQKVACRLNKKSDEINAEMNGVINACQLGRKYADLPASSSGEPGSSQKDGEYEEDRDKFAAHSEY